MDVLREAALAFSTSNTDEIIQKEALKNLEHWLTSPDLKEYVPYIEHVAANKNFDLLLDCFWRMIPFGTGGRRGAIGAGPNRINPYTINLSVQGHCKYLREVVGAKGDFSVVVAHDVRQFFDMRGLYENVDGILKGITSLDMAKEAAKTYAANGIKAYVVGPLEDGPDGKICKDKYISTPELSFLIRRYGAAGGLNISASHNHPDDNGGKFYNKEGGQEIPPDDEALLKVVETVDTVLSMPYSEAREKGLIQYVSKEDHQAYLDLNMALSHTSSRSAKIGFSPLCGTGMTTVYPTLKGLGYTVEKVEAQCDYDGSFAPVVYRIANPEVPESMQILEQVCVEKNCDIGFSTDPDADRLGIVVSNGKGGFEFVNGNEIGVLLIQSIVSSKKQANLLPENPLFINTLVTSSLQKEIAQKNGCQVVGDLMVGFKYIGDVLKHVDQNGCFPPKAEAEGRDTAQGTIGDYVFGTEESHGYLLTPEIRDKDACGAAVHLAGLASELKDTNKTFDSYLRDIYKVYGYHRNSLRSLVMEGIVGLKRIKKSKMCLEKIHQRK